MLFGRERELLIINEVLAAPRLGKSSRLIIRGQPGIGKTALLEYATTQAASMQVLSARGVEFEADLPFAGLHELLRPALGSIDQLPPIHAAALRSSLGLGERIEADRLIVGAAVLGLISAHADKGPLLITIDDANWIDRSSAEAIAFAARRLVADPVAILVAVREGEDSPLVSAGLPELTLAGLDEAAAAKLLERTNANDSSAEFVRHFLQSTGGNPLALIELGRAITQLPLSPYEELPIATSVERAYLRRAERLSDGARQALLVVAASGVADLALVRRAAQALGIHPSDLEQAESTAGLVARNARRLEFVHPLARSAIYHSASPEARRAVHRALARMMSDPSDVDRQAWHLAAGAIGWDREAADALEKTALRARESTGYDAAANALAEAARLTEAPERRAERLFLAADNAWLAGRAEHALELLTAAKKLAQTRERHVDIENLSGQIAMRRGAVMQGYATLIAAAEAIEPIDRLKAVRILADAALSTFGAGHPGDTVAAATRGLALLRPTDPAEPKIFARVAFGALAILAGRGSDGPDRLHESVALFDEVSIDTIDPLLLMCECVAGLFLREARAGRDLLDKALRQARERAPTAALPAVLFMLGRDAAATDRWPLARAQYEEAARIARETTQYTWLAAAMSGLSWLDALEGREEECRRHADEGRRLSQQYEMGFYASWTMIALGLLELALGKPDGALRHFVECTAFLKEISIEDPDLSPAPDIVEVLVRLGRLDEARTASEQFFVSAAAKGQPFALARAARTRALIAADGRYEETFEEALRHHRATTDVFEMARTELSYGERLRRSRQRVEARKHLRAALNLFDQLGAAPWSDHASAELQASGETARVRDDSTRERLTPQELQVALALAAGATTREAATRLYISPKTVEYHLRHVYAKLDIRSRDELRHALRSGSHSPEARAGR